MYIDQGLDMVINFQEFDNLMNANTNRPSLKRGSDSLNRPVNMRIKICLLGDGAVGKTSLVRRFVKNMFTDDYIITVGTKTSKKKLVIKKPEFLDILPSYPLIFTDVSLSYFTNYNINKFWFNTITWSFHN